jgi:sulfur dioxygenase
MIFRQLFDRSSCTYTYLLADREIKEGILIDPVIEQVDRDLNLINQLGIKLLYSLETHIHADHITGAGKIRKETNCQIALGKDSGAKTADLLLQDGEEVIFGNHKLTAHLTPGHTLGCTSYVCEDKIFTGDTLFIRSCGRTDFQGGSSGELYTNVNDKIFSLPDEFFIYPGHDYNGRTVSTVLEEKLFNPRLNKNNSKEKFIMIMEELKLSLPEKIKEAVPANIFCGDEK